MGYVEKFLYCEDDKDTRTLLETLQDGGNKGFKILTVLTLKKDWNAKYRNAEGINVNGKIIPFTFTSVTEMEHPDLYYRKPLAKLTDKDIADMKNGNASQAFGDEQEHFFHKGDTLIWINGNRGNIKDGYSLFGLSDAAENSLFNTMHDADFPKHFLVDGKLDIVNALPYANEMAVDGLVTMGLLSSDNARIIKNVKMIDLDGLPGVDSLLKRTDLFLEETHLKK